MQQTEILKQINEILKDQCDDPALEIIKNGKCLMDIGKALKGKTQAEARSIMQAVEAMKDVT